MEIEYKNLIRDQEYLVIFKNGFICKMIYRTQDKNHIWLSYIDSRLFDVNKISIFPKNIIVKIRSLIE